MKRRQTARGSQRTTSCTSHHKLSSAIVLLTLYNRENASVVLNEYLEGIGGREKLFAETNAALKGKKRGRPSTGTPQTTKRSKKNGDVDSDVPLTVRSAPWKPPSGSWEDHIAQLDACEDEDSGKLMVYLTWKNGHKTQHETSLIYQRCPQKVCFLSSVIVDS